jgi:hypothetical protein
MTEVLVAPMVEERRSVSIDKVVIQGAEFTRVGERYLLQSEVERALDRLRTAPIPHVERLTTLLEDIVSTADAVALEVVETQSREVDSERRFDLRGEQRTAEERSLDDPARALLLQVRDELREQVLLIDTFMQRIEG